MGQKDVEYFSRRLREEQEAAERAVPPASAIHRELADRYADMLSSREKKRG